nr:MAG TPA: hypothetical protein [Caudoviricetes sp.]
MFLLLCILIIYGPSQGHKIKENKNIRRIKL